MQSLLQKVSFYLHYSLDINKDKMIPSAELRSETSPDHARMSFYLYLGPMNNKDRMTP